MLFFYNRDTRTAASGTLNAVEGGFTNLKNFDAAAGFGDWTHIVPVFNVLFFYNQVTRTAASGRLNADGSFVNLQDFPTGFGFWSHIVPGFGSLFFYNQVSRTGASGKLNASTGNYVNQKNFDAAAEPSAKFWTHIVESETGHGLAVFYNKNTRTAASGTFFDDGSFANLQNFDAATGFGDWTHIVPTLSGLHFFYNKDTRTASTRKFTENGSFANLKDFFTGFGVWTHIVEDQNVLFFYNKDTRTAASGILLEDKFTNLQDFGPAAGFSEWTHIVGTSR